MPHELPKAYDPGQIESRWAEYWVSNKLFHVETPATPDHEHTFTLLLPPPNVTGRLHMGHMLNQTEMDIIVRWHRMRGFRTLWLPGTDHAGIATQMMVERQLAKEGKKRTDLGREKFIERVWDWKKEYGGAILEQMKRLGASVDWSREYFTMDDNLSHSVREAFVRWWEEGLIYRGAYIVNWCPRCVTAISDLETIHEETPGKLWEIRYPVIGTDEFITVATTRPETMLGDTAVAVNPRDERYTHLHGKKLMLPLMNREIPLILDELAQPEFGTGAVKVTPAHDPNDFEAGLRHKLPQIRIMDEHAMMNENAGPYAGHDRYEARERVIHDLQEQGFLVAAKDYSVPLGKCDRCKTIVEPRLSTQWFVAVNKTPKSGGPSIAKIAQDVVKNGDITFTPENYKTIYLNWMENIHDWCISRQLWWGHRIPAWHCADCKEIVVAREEPTKCTKCGSSKLEQDTDVLDTWFSSGLLPASPMGWPEKTADQATFYPTTLLITGFDILFFWVARMIMMNTFFMWRDHKDGVALKSAVPFENVYIHGLVRDADRQKMSKTKGNVLDPIQVIEQYGTDATRFTLASMASPGTDIAFNEDRVQGYRAFANKIWNAARFIFMNVDKGEQDDIGDSGWIKLGHSKKDVIPLEDRWILSRLNRVTKEVNDSLAQYRFDLAANSLYSFFWGEFCDWYLELVKPRLFGDDTSEKRMERSQALGTLTGVFTNAVLLLSPFMPFITEELCQFMLKNEEGGFQSVALMPYPQPQEHMDDSEAETEMAILQDLIVAVRNVRAELKVEPKVKVPVEIHAQPEIREMIEHNRGALERLAGVEGITFTDTTFTQSAGVRSTTRFDVHVIYEQKIDVAAERERLTKELEKMDKERSNAERQLGNQNFLAKAPAHVVEGIKRRAGELDILIEKAKAALAQLG
jgi:valyl-tRNA synthetase